jgi:hypothetical protein
MTMSEHPGYTIFLAQSRRLGTAQRRQYAQKPER